MDHCPSSSIDFWNTFQSEEPQLLPPNVATHSDIGAYGSQPACHFQTNLSSWESLSPCSYPYTQVVHPVDEINGFSDCYSSPSYQQLERVPQDYLGTQVDHEAAYFQGNQFLVSPSVQETCLLPPEQVNYTVQTKEYNSLISTTQNNVMNSLSQLATNKHPDSPRDFSQNTEYSTPNKILEESTAKRRHRNKKHRYHIGGIHACPFCDRSFLSKSGLSQHKDAHHSGTKPECCNICGKRFHLRADLEKHELRHKDQNKRWKCEDCPKKYNYKDDMNRHYTAAHTAESPFKCQSCGQGFGRMDHLQGHKKYACKGTMKKRFLERKEI